MVEKAKGRSRLQYPALAQVYDVVGIVVVVTDDRSGHRADALVFAEFP